MPKTATTSTVALLHQSFTCTAFLPLLEQESLFFMELQQTKICCENHVARQNCISFNTAKKGLVILIKYKTWNIIKLVPRRG
jgi:hypothetical protein